MESNSTNSSSEDSKLEEKKIDDSTSDHSEDEDEYYEDFNNNPEESKEVSLAILGKFIEIFGVVNSFQETQYALICVKFRLSIFNWKVVQRIQLNRDTLRRKVTSELTG
jgi:hypothetical protein